MFIKFIFVKRIMIALVVISMGFIACNKLVDIDPPVANLTTLTAFSDDNAAIAVMTGHFSALSNESFFTSFTGVPIFTGLSSDELTLWEGSSNESLISYYKNALFSNAGGSAGDECWPFPKIYACNTVIEGVASSNSLSLSVKNQLLGEAKFMRALYFFYLVNLYGDVPLPLNTDFEVNRLLSRRSKKDVYKQIIADLLDAQSLLSIDFLNGGLKKYLPNVIAERVRPTKWAAAALLARAYLYNGDYVNAELSASSVIDNTSLFGLVTLNDVFKKNSREAIWQLQPVAAGMNTCDGAVFILSDAGPTEYSPVYVSKFLLNSFEAGDKRNVTGNWINSVTVLGTTYFYPYKYKLGLGSEPGTEYLMMLRLGELYLIRAEARAQQNNIPGSVADINMIRARARAAATVDVPDPLPNLPGALTKEQLMAAIIHERQVELFAEWGHRWFDLKRTGKVDAIMSVVTPLKGGAWELTDQVYPIPNFDILRNPNLVQNAGY
ncbi:RagB/SusD family nutrient uptake outer membrane protein [Paraflavitalea soli]|uniref:RagB/SusD family nutrient uptake outer membrane protein n=1 Tax=Paraflavitalea soli TaxID=2315862 RepID=A0A3B7MKQ7_9BACT|nr:RagB/SusD family nutrient uptake outer membrane protein [Paraflavitalea soli]AXY74758.1 RagB/SusD family nutrient uptake outer membrane protein [Paraflavitalea soli]